MVTYRVENETLIIEIHGQITSSNASDFEKQVNVLRQQQNLKGLIFDAKDLEYISSAGLRVILHFVKDVPTFKMINVSSDVYEVLEMTGFTEIFTVEKAYRNLSVDGCEILGQGSNGIVYRYDDDIVVKVYRNSDALDEIHREKELARKALILGIPTAISYDVVRVGDKYASVFELLNAKSFSKLFREEPENTDQYLKLYIELLQQIHNTEVNPNDMPNMKDVVVDWANFLKDYLPNEHFEKLVALVNDIPEKTTMIHGDYHTNNVEMQDGEVLLIDMDTLSYGHPIFELASMYMGLVGFGEINPENTEKFFNLNYQITKQLWSDGLKIYLNSEDEEYVESVENMAKIIAYTRIMRRSIRRDGVDSAQGIKTIEFCRNNLLDLIDKTDTLDFQIA